MADARLDGGVQFSERLAVANWNEQRVVPEAVASVRRMVDATLNGALRGVRLAIEVDKHAATHETRGPIFVGHVFQQAQKLHVVVFIRAALACESCGDDARRAVQRIHNEAGIVGNAGSLQTLGVVLGLERGVALEGLCILDRRGN